MPLTEPPAGASRHPWNEDFVWSLPATTPTAITAEERTAFDRDGFLVLRELIDASTLVSLRAELDELEVEMEDLLSTQEDGRLHIAESGAITFTVHAVLRSAAALVRSLSIRRWSGSATTSSGQTSTSTGTKRSTRSLRSHVDFRGIRTLATSSSSRSST